MRMGDQMGMGTAAQSWMGMPSQRDTRQALKGILPVLSPMDILLVPSQMGIPQVQMDMQVPSRTDSQLGQIRLDMVP